MKGCLDTWCVFAWIDDERAAADVERCLRDGATMNWINLGEVDYIARRRFGDAGAADLLTTLERLVLASI